MDKSKHCMKIIFGDKEAYLNKFKTCVRARPVELHALSTSFHEIVYKIPYRRAPRLACRLPSASREQRYLAYNS